jgi:hypothetical protein
MVDFNLIMKDHIHGLAIRLWSDDEQDINTLSILWIHLNLKCLSSDLKNNI